MNWLILKVGTAVVTRNDGRLALGRLGALCEQVCYFFYASLWIKLGWFYLLFYLPRSNMVKVSNNVQIKELNSQGFEIILVSSGAVGLGRQRLRYRRLVNSRFFVYPFQFRVVMFGCIFWAWKSKLMPCIKKEKGKN